VVKWQILSEKSRISELPQNTKEIVPLQPRSTSRCGRLFLDYHVIIVCFVQTILAILSAHPVS
jgi:hypothetical protein